MGTLMFSWKNSAKRENIFGQKHVIMRRNVSDDGDMSLWCSEYFPVLSRIFSSVVYIMVLCLLEYFPVLVKIISLCCSEYFSLLFRVKCFAKCNNFSRESLQEEYSWTCEKLKLAKWFKYYLKCYLQSIIGLHIIIS